MRPSRRCHHGVTWDPIVPAFLLRKVSSPLYSFLSKRPRIFSNIQGARRSLLKAAKALLLFRRCLPPCAARPWYKVRGTCSAIDHGE